MNVRWRVVALILVTAVSAEASTIVTVAGRVVSAEGKPVVGAQIAEFWFAEQEGPLKPSRPAVSGTDGRFSLEVELYNRDTLVMAVDSSGTLGGVATVLVKAPQELIEIPLRPLGEVRGRYLSESSDRPLHETYVTIFLSGGELRVAAGRSRTADFAMKLPPGRYTVHGHEPRHLRDEREITLEPGTAVDLGELKLQLKPFTRLFGKPAPAWHITGCGKRPRRRGTRKEGDPRIPG
jgi:hypothetical protein